MAIIQSGASSQLWTVDPISAAGRVTLYDSSGNELAGIGVLKSLNNILDSLNENVTLILSGQATTSIQLYATTGSLTVSFEASIDGINWFPVLAQSLSGGAPTYTTSSDGVWFLNTSGYFAVKSIVTSFTSGNTEVSMIAVPEDRGLSTISISGNGQDNTTNSASKLPVLAARSNTSNPTWTDGYMVPLSVDTSGNLRVSGTVTVAKSSTSNLTSVAASASSTTLLAPNSNRISAMFCNDSTSVMYLALGTTASTTLFSVKIYPGSYWELSASYDGIISGIWVSANGAMRITELLP